MDCCSVETGRPVLTIGFGVFCWVWVCWEFSPPAATSEPNSLIQLYYKENFGGGWGDTYTSEPFFEKENGNRTLNVPSSHLHSTVTPITDDLLHRWESDHRHRTGVQEGHGESLQPKSTHHRLNQARRASFWSSSGTSRPTPEKTRSQQSPWTTGFPLQRPTRPIELCPLLLRVQGKCALSSCVLRPRPCRQSGLCICAPIPVERGHHGRVDCKLRSSKQGKGHLPPPPTALPVGLGQIQVTDEHVGPDSGSPFSANSCRNRLQSPPSPPQDPCCRASCGGGQRRRVDGHTGNCGLTEEGQTKSCGGEGRQMEQDRSWSFDSSGNMRTGCSPNP